MAYQPLVFLSMLVQVICHSTGIFFNQLEHVAENGMVSFVVSRAKDILGGSRGVDRDGKDQRQRQDSADGSREHHFCHSLSLWLN